MYYLFAMSFKVRTVKFGCTFSMDILKIIGEIEEARKEKIFRDYNITSCEGDVIADSDRGILQHFFILLTIPA